MSGVAVRAGELRRRAHVSTHASPYDMVLSELCSALFASLPRSDQRGKGAEYVRGLLETPGRKSIRNIAALLGGQAIEQSLHHFISSSTWDWVPVRQALAQYLVRTAPPQAWVVRPMVIPKAGERSVGVDKRFISALGQVRNAQQAMGVWAVSDEMSSPINWRLHLSRAWLDDDRRRRQASIPDGLRPETLGDCAIMAYLGMTTRWKLPVRPVVLDARDTDALTTVQKLHVAGVPLLVRINSTLRLTAVDPDLPGHSVDALPAHQILGAVRNRRRPVTWMDHGRVGVMRTSLAATVRVRMPSSREETGHATGRGALLLGMSENGQGWPKELWLTDLMAAQPAFLLRLSRLIHRVDQDFTEIADRVGIRDFAGRSFDGWHRHVTLASAAHAVAALANPGSSRRSWEAG